MNKTVEHISPEDAQTNDRHRQRQFVIRDENGAIVAGAEIDRYSRPIPIYQVTDLWSDVPGQGYASAIMDDVEEFMKRTRKPGILVDAIDADSQASGMYERRGWEYVPEQHGLMVYNWRSEKPMSILAGYAMRSTPLFEREHFAENWLSSEDAHND